VGVEAVQSYKTDAFCAGRVCLGRIRTLRDATRDNLLTRQAAASTSRFRKTLKQSL